MKFTWVLLFMLVRADQEIMQTNVESEEDFFEATEEWKEIMPGQVVPQGLHYRINLESGKKEAKLLNSEESIARIRNDPIQSNPSNVLKESFVNLQRQDDAESMKHLIANFKNSSLDSLKAIMEDLEYFLHQVDNAVNFINMNGLENVSIPGLHSNFSEIRSASCLMIGAMLQNNRDAKDLTLLHHQTLLPLVLERISDSKEDISIRRSCIYALSCFIRNHEPGFDSFVNEYEGLKVVLRVLQSRNQGLQIKLLTFIIDLVQEPWWTEDLTRQLRQNSICSLAINIFKEMSGDVEKIIDVLYVLNPHCKISFDDVFVSKLESTVRRFKEVQGYESMLVKINHILRVIKIEL